MELQCSGHVFMRKMAGGGADTLRRTKPGG
jgi:hypothetical protein